MSDNWSLKDKHSELDTKYYKCLIPRGQTIVDIYLKEDIEILRQKIQKLVWDALQEEENPLWVKKEINRLFGVER